MTGRGRLRQVPDSLLLWTGHHMSLGFKIALPVLISTVILVGVLGAIVAGDVSLQIDRAYQAQVAGVASAVQVTYMEYPYDVPELNRYLAQLIETSHSNLISVRIVGLDARTTVIASSSSLEVGAPGAVTPPERQAVRAGKALQVQGDGSGLTTIYPLRDSQGTLFGAIFITSSTAAETAATQSIIKTIATVGLVAILIDSALILSALYFGIIRRTRRVQRAVEAVATGDTSVRLAEGGESRGRDEIFNLARSVGQMIERLDERERGDDLIRHLGQNALEGFSPEALMAEALRSTCETLHLETCMFVSFSPEGSIASCIDESGKERKAGAIPIWVYALTKVAVGARKTVVADHQGDHSRFAGGAGPVGLTEAVVLPLPRTSREGQAIVAIAAPGETILDGGIAVLDAVAATIAERFHMQQADEARAESAVKSKVMASVSHEMRNPLNSILGFTGLVLDASNENLTAKQRRQLGFVQTSAANMLNLINNYLDLAKLRSGTVSVQYETVKLGPLVGEVVDLMQPIAGARNLTLKTSVTADAEARLDPTRFRQILTNLVSNAVKFTPDGGNVYVRARVDRDTCRLAVSDTGVGMPKDHVKLVFDEFSKIDAGRLAASKGTGLGLALCKAFVTTMGGTIRCYSRRGRGTTFVVLLPRNRQVPRQANAA